MRNFTHNDLINSSYRKLSQEDALAFKALFKESEALEKLYEEIELNYSVLINFITEPDRQVVSKLIQYANRIPTKVHLN